MQIFDAHADVLYKMWMDQGISFKDSEQLHINLNGLGHYHKNVQCFAIYVPEHVLFEQRFQVALEMVEIFHTQILNQYEQIKFVQTKADIDKLAEGEIGAMLTLEGCDAIGGDMVKLMTLLRLGVSSVGLTWNYANLVADGVLEQRGAGLTRFGVEVVKQLNDAKVWTDVSHLSVQSFWDTIEIAEYPIASHSNAYQIFNHRRNITDEQIKAIIQKNGVIGVTFVPSFLANEQEKATISHILNHVEHICELGGARHIGFGSDFDGIETTVARLGKYVQYGNLIEELLKHYSETQVKRFCFQNFVDHLPK